MIGVKEKASLKTLRPFLKNMSEIGIIRDRMVGYHEQVDFIIGKVRARQSYFDAKLEILTSKWAFLSGKLMDAALRGKVKDKKAKDFVMKVGLVPEEVRQNIL